MRKTTAGIKGQVISVDTPELMNMLHVGRKAATDIGTAANARITIGRRHILEFWRQQRVMIRLLASSSSVMQSTTSGKHYTAIMRIAAVW